MDVLSTMAIECVGAEREVRLLAGDLVDLPALEAVDVLVVSAFRGDYTPTPGSLIGSLNRKGVSVADLARDKEVDLLAFSNCWLSKPIDRPDLNISRILCFEPEAPARAPEAAGDVFRSIIPLASGDPPIRRIGLPLLAAGDQGESPLLMLASLAEAAAEWLKNGLAVDRISIVVRSKWLGSPELISVFEEVKARHVAQPEPEPCHRFDAFISYSHRDKDAVDDLVEDLTTLRPDLRLFVDRLELKPGAAWQQHIFESLDDSRRVIAVLSPDYLTSKMCQIEFNMAFLRHTTADQQVLKPLYLRSAALPTYMQLIQYTDAREGDRGLITSAASVLADVI